MAFRRKKREDPRVELTPMVDVVFLLLIFFMISTTFVENPGISIKLPQSQSRILEKEPREVKIYLSKEGTVFFEEKEVPSDRLPGLLGRFGEDAREMTFVLLADEEDRHGRVVQLMDMAKEAGFAKLAIATEPRRNP